MSDDEKIGLDDLILFFRGPKIGDEETIVNRWIPHSFYTDPQRKVALKPGWKEAVFSEPTAASQAKPYYVANLARLVPPDELQPVTKAAAPAKAVDPQPDDLIVFPPEDPESCFLVKRSEYNDQCQELPDADIPDLEFMAREEGVLLACLPKVTPEGCTCILLNLVSLRSGMLGDATTTRTTLTKKIREVYRHRDQRRKP